MNKPSNEMNSTDNSQESDAGQDDNQDLNSAIAMFGQDLLDVLADEGEDDLDLLCTQASTARHGNHSSQAEHVELVLESYAEKLHENPKLAFAGSIAMACNQAADSGSRTELRYVVFSFDTLRLGLPMESIVEIAHIGHIAPLPRTASWLKGTTSFRGNLISVTDIASLLQIPVSPSAQPQKMIVLRGKDVSATTAILVERIVGIRSLSESPNSCAELPDFVAELALGTSVIDDQTVVLIDPDKFLGSSALVQYMQ